MVNGLPSLAAGKVLILGTTRFSVLGRPAGPSPPGSPTDRQPARRRAAPRHGSRQWLAHDPECGSRHGDRVGPWQDGGSERRAYNAYGEGGEGRPPTHRPKISFQAATGPLPPGLPL